jgi:serine/threonine-protein kinase RsbW
MAGDSDTVSMVKLSVPGTLLYRDVVLRTVESMCRLVRSGVNLEQEPDHDGPEMNFDDQIVSAVGEAFNNIALHGYSTSHRGDVDIELEFQRQALTIRLYDRGKGFDLANQSSPDLDSLPESRMGLYIIRALMDEVTYERGIPPSQNVLTLTKRFLPLVAMDARAGRE